MRTGALAMLGALALGAAGCGEDSGDGDASPPAGGSQTRLELTLDADGPGPEPKRSFEVACAAGDPCDELAGIERADFEPVPPGVACTEIYGGPDVLTVSGSFEGEPVEAVLTRANGCEIERFEAFTALLSERFPAYEPGASLSP